MDDTISRQAAIYVASGYCHPANIAKELAKLPSVQPEVTEEEVKEYCRKRCLCIVDSALLKKYASAQAYVPDTNVGDIISRQAAIDAIENAFDRETILNRFVRKIAISAVRLLPPAQPEQRWIPCSERLPKVCEFVNCTCRSLIDDREDWVIETAYIPQSSGSPYSDWGNIPMLNDGKCEVIAWMHRNIPEPYKAEMESEE